MRIRPAPSARRISNSRCRAEPRTSVRFAAFTQAIRSTNTTAPNRRNNAGRMSRVMSSCSRPRREADFAAGSAIKWRCLPPFHAGIKIRVLLLELRCEDLQLGVRLIESDAGPEPR